MGNLGGPLWTQASKPRWRQNIQQTRYAKTSSRPMRGEGSPPLSRLIPLSHVRPSAPQKITVTPTLQPFRLREQRAVAPSTPQDSRNGLMLWQKQRKAERPRSTASGCQRKGRTDVEDLRACSGRPVPTRPRLRTDSSSMTWWRCPRWRQPLPDTSSGWCLHEMKEYPPFHAPTSLKSPLFHSGPQTSLPPSSSDSDPHHLPPVLTNKDELTFTRGGS